MKFILLLIVIVAIVAVVLVVMRRRQDKPVSVPFNKPFDDLPNVGDGDLNENHLLMKVKPGDMLYDYTDVMSTNKIVVGTLACEQAGSAWLNMRLDDNSWLSFEPGANAQFTRWKQLAFNEVALPGPMSRTLEYGGVTYTRGDSGSATYVSRGDTGLRREGILEFGEFHSPRGMDGTQQSISFEQYDDGDFTLSIGERLDPSSWTVFEKDTDTPA